MDKEMQRALEADGEKLRQFTGEDHGPRFVRIKEPCGHPDCEFPLCDAKCLRRHPRRAQVTDAKLIKFVASFRRGIVGRGRSDCMCFAVCAPLTTLLNMNGVENRMQEGRIKFELGECNHFWIVLADGRVIDPTADQFNRRLGKAFPRIYLGAPDGDIHVAVGGAL